MVEKLAFQTDLKVGRPVWLITRWNRRTLRRTDVGTADTVSRSNARVSHPIGCKLELRRYKISECVSVGMQLRSIRYLGRLNRAWRLLQWNR